MAHFSGGSSLGVVLVASALLTLAGSVGPGARSARALALTCSGVGNGQPLSFRSQHGCLVPVRALFKWLCRQNLLLANPAADLDLPRAEKRLPRHVLTASEAERVLGLPDVGGADALGLRDRAILETLYSTGMRRMELIGLKLYDLDPERGTLFVRQGKGKKDRMIPNGGACV